ncbi:MAG: hypothetical protein P4M07_21685, partial [Xanthobacteraceae bacterium]|nr:hypothetical protein [Xanthobacteraceae bacterium]
GAVVPPVRGGGATGRASHAIRARLFRAGRPAPAVPPVIPIVRAPDDPGVDDAAVGDDFRDEVAAPAAQPGGWRGFLSRFGA